MSFSELLSLSFAAILGENLVFVRLFGVDSLGKSVKSTALFGGAMVPVMALSSAVAALAYGYILKPLGLEHLQLLVFVAIAALFAKGTEAVADVVVKEKTDLFPLVALNSALLGVMLLNVQTGYSATESLVYGALLAIGFAFALFIYHSVSERLRIASPSASFEGSPLAFIAIGLVAMAFMGFADVDLGTIAALPFKLVR